MEDIMKMVKYLEESHLQIKVGIKTIGNETKEQRGGFLGMLLSTLGATLLGNMLAGKSVIKDGERTIGAGENSWHYLSFNSFWNS